MTVLPNASLSLSAPVFLYLFLLLLLPPSFSLPSLSPHKSLCFVWLSMCLDRPCLFICCQAAPIHFHSSLPAHALNHCVFLLFPTPTIVASPLLYLYIYLFSLSLSLPYLVGLTAIYHCAMRGCNVRCVELLLKVRVSIDF